MREESIWRERERKIKNAALFRGGRGNIKGLEHKVWRREREREREAKDSLDRVSGRKTFPSEILSGFYEALRPPFIFIAPCYGMKSSVFIAPTYFWTVEELERIFLSNEYYLNL